MFANLLRRFTAALLVLCLVGPADLALAWQTSVLPKISPIHGIEVTPNTVFEQQTIPSPMAWFIEAVTNVGWRVRAMHRNFVPAPVPSSDEGSLGRSSYRRPPIRPPAPPLEFDRTTVVVKPAAETVILYAVRYLWSGVWAPFLLAILHPIVEWMEWLWNPRANEKPSLFRQIFIDLPLRFGLGSLFLFVPLAVFQNVDPAVWANPTTQWLTAVFTSFTLHAIYNWLKDNGYLYDWMPYMAVRMHRTRIAPFTISIGGQSSPDPYYLMEAYIRDRGNVAELAYEKFKLAAYSVAEFKTDGVDVVLENGFRYGPVEVDSLLSAEQQKKLESWIRSHRIDDQPVKFLVLRNQPALHWDHNMENALWAASDARYNTIYIGEYLLRRLFSNGQEELRKRVLDDCLVDYLSRARKKPRSVSMPRRASSQLLRQVIANTSNFSRTYTLDKPGEVFVQQIMHRLRSKSNIMANAIFQQAIARNDAVQLLNLLEGANTPILQDVPPVVTPIITCLADALNETRDPHLLPLLSDLLESHHNPLARAAFDALARLESSGNERATDILAQRGSRFYKPDMIDNHLITHLVRIARALQNQSQTHILIRDAVLEDLPRIKMLHNLKFSSRPYIDEMHDEIYDWEKHYENTLLRKSPDQHQRIHVAVDKSSGKIMGYSFVVGRIHMQSLMAEMVVDPNSRGMGIGKALFARGIEFLLRNPHYLEYPIKVTDDAGKNKQPGAISEIAQKYFGFVKEPPSTIDLFPEPPELYLTLKQTYSNYILRSKRLVPKSFHRPSSNVPGKGEKSTSSTGMAVAGSWIVGIATFAISYFVHSHGGMAAGLGIAFFGTYYFISQGIRIYDALIASGRTHQKAMREAVGDARTGVHDLDLPPQLEGLVRRHEARVHFLSRRLRQGSVAESVVAVLEDTFVSLIIDPLADAKTWLEGRARANLAVQVRLERRRLIQDMRARGQPVDLNTLGARIIAALELNPQIHASPAEIHEAVEAIVTAPDTELEGSTQPGYIAKHTKKFFDRMVLLIGFALMKYGPGMVILSIALSLTHFFDFPALATIIAACALNALVSLLTPSMNRAQISVHRNWNTAVWAFLPTNLAVRFQMKLLSKGPIPWITAGQYQQDSGIQPKEKEFAQVIAEKLRTPLRGFPEDLQKHALMTARYERGGHLQDGYGVPVGSAIDGSHAFEGEQGYYVKNANGEETGQEKFLEGINIYKRFFERHRQRGSQNEIRLIVKPGIGGQHTPNQAISDVFQVIDAVSGVVIGEYELGKDVVAEVERIMKEMNITWRQVAIIPSSKSGSTDETMIIFVSLLKASFEYFANMCKARDSEKQNIDGRRFADLLFSILHEINFPDGQEVKTENLFRVDPEKFGTSSLISLVHRRANDAGIAMEMLDVRGIFADVLGRMVFETTPEPEHSRLAAFIKNTELINELGDDAPECIEMFDNIGGRWTVDLHMMLYLAYHNLDPLAYWKSRHDEIARIRTNESQANTWGDYILDSGIEQIAVVVPSYLYWFGKSIEQNFNESLWQHGSPILKVYSEEQWKRVHPFYGTEQSLIINLTESSMQHLYHAPLFLTLDIPKFVNGSIDTSLQAKNEVARNIGQFYSIFYGITTTIGNRLLARALMAKNIDANDLDLNDLDSSVTQVIQNNLYFRQPLVELGKDSLEKKFTALQAKGPKVVQADLRKAQRAAQKGRWRSNFNLPSLGKSGEAGEDLISLIGGLLEQAEKENREPVPLLYRSGAEYRDMRDGLLNAGVKWVLQGSGDQHINVQKKAGQQSKFLPIIVSFLPAEEMEMPGLPAIGFTKGYLHNVSPHHVSDAFSYATYKAFTSKDPKKGVGGQAIHIRLPDTDEARADLIKAFQVAMQYKSGGATPRNHNGFKRVITNLVTPLRWVFDPIGAMAGFSLPRAWDRILRHPTLAAPPRLLLSFCAAA